ncbi:hypothetical protein [uncultured Psychroserpens sp.]|uniref:hypothetical protein n=1 Tax=uncultured Psychroserpens sp. TaxID=255436 RepID=UPI0026321236|nr:hypothetical protein [uncultured Psychroserpens sp.]
MRYYLINIVAVVLFSSNAIAQDNLYLTIYDKNPKISVSKSQIDKLNGLLIEDTEVLEKIKWLDESIPLDEIESLSYDLLRECEGENAKCIINFFKSKVHALDSLRKNLFKKYPTIIAESLPFKYDSQDKIKEIGSVISSIELLYRGILNKLPNELKFSESNSGSKADLSKGLKELDTLKDDDITKIKTVIDQIKAKLKKMSINSNKDAGIQDVKALFDEIKQINVTKDNIDVLIKLLGNLIEKHKILLWEKIKELHQKELDKTLLDEYKSLYDSTTHSAETYKSFIKKQYYSIRNYFESIGIDSSKVKNDTTIVEVDLTDASIEKYGDLLFKRCKNKEGLISNAESVFDVLHQDYNTDSTGNKIRTYYDKFLENSVSDDLYKFLKEHSEKEMSKAYLNALKTLTKKNSIVYKDSLYNITIAEVPTEFDITKDTISNDWIINRKSILQLNMTLLSGRSKVEGTDSIVPIYWNIKVDTLFSEVKTIKSKLNLQNIEGALEQLDSTMTRIANFEANQKKTINKFFSDKVKEYGLDIVQEKVDEIRRTFKDYIVFTTEFSDDPIVIYWKDEPQIKGEKFHIEEIAKKIQDGSWSDALFNLIEQRLKKEFQREVETVVKPYMAQFEQAINSFSEKFDHLQIGKLRFNPENTFGIDSVAVNYQVYYDSHHIGYIKGQMSYGMKAPYLNDHIDYEKLFYVAIGRNLKKESFIVLEDYKAVENKESYEVYLQYKGIKEHFATLIIADDTIEVSLVDDLKIAFLGYEFLIKNFEYKSNKVILSGNVFESGSSVGEHEMKIGEDLQISLTNISEVYLTALNKNFHINVTDIIDIKELSIKRNTLHYKFKINTEKINNTDVIELLSILGLDETSFYTLSDIENAWDANKEQVYKKILNKAEQKGLELLMAYLSDEFDFNIDNWEGQITSNLRLEFINSDSDDSITLAIFIDNLTSGSDTNWLLKITRSASNPEDVDYSVNNALLYGFMDDNMPDLISDCPCKLDFKDSKFFLDINEVQLGDNKYDLKFEITLEGKITLINQDEVARHIATNGIDLLFIENLFPDYGFIINNFRPNAIEKSALFDLTVKFDDEWFNIKNISINSDKRINWSRAVFNFDALERKINNLDFVEEGSTRISHVKSKEENNPGDLLIDYNIVLLDSKIPVRTILSLKSGDVDLSSSIIDVLFKKIKSSLDERKKDLKFLFGDFVLAYSNSELKDDGLKVDFLLSNTGYDNDIIGCFSSLKISQDISKEGKIEDPSIDYSEKSVRECVEDSLKGELASIMEKYLDFIDQKWVKITSIEPIKTEGNIPTGFKVNAQVNVFEYFSIGIPPVFVDIKKGITTGDLDRISFTLNQSIPIPPFLSLTDLGGEISKKEITATGKIVPVDGNLKKIIHLKGDLTIPIKEDFYITHEGSLVLLNTISLMNRRDSLRINPLYIKSESSTNKTFEDIFYFSTNLELVEKSLKGDLQGKFLKYFTIDGDFEVDINKKEIKASANGELIIANVKGDLIIAPKGSSLYAKLSAEMNLKVGDQKISSVKTFVEPNAAGVNFKFLGLNLGAVVPSHHSLDKDLIWNLIKDLLTVDLDDIPKLIESVLKGNLNINPFGDFGSEGDGISANKKRGGQEGSGAKANSNGGNNGYYQQNMNHSFEGSGIDQISAGQIAYMNKTMTEKDFEKAFENPSKEKDGLAQQLENGIKVETYGGTAPGPYYKFKYHKGSKTWSAKAEGDATIKDLLIDNSILKVNEEYLPKRFKRIRRKVNSGVVAFYDANTLYFYSEKNPKGVKIPVNLVSWRANKTNPFWLIYDNGLEDFIADITIPDKHDFFPVNEDYLVYRVCENEDSTKCYSFILSNDLKEFICPYEKNVDQPRFEPMNKEKFKADFIRILEKREKCK